MLPRRHTLLHACLAIALIAAPAAIAQSDSSEDTASQLSTSSDGVFEYRVYDVAGLASPGVHDAESSAELALKVAESLGYRAETLGPDLISLFADDFSHKIYGSAIGAIHGEPRPRVGLRIRALSLSPESPARIGEAPPREGAALILEDQRFVRRGVLSRLEAVREVTYVADVNPIVGNSAVAQDPTIATVDEGLHLDVRVGESGPNGSAIMISGEIARVELRPVKGFAFAPVADEGPYELPEIRRRTFNSETTVRAGAETIIAIVPDPDDATKRIAITVEHWRVE
ncbi:MAG: hypothetical protein VYC34_11565 [Planctomycetota bacterium]|nr:hypothetical protein [Planctomycetota bacterium]